MSAPADVRGRCPVCAMTRDQRLGYEGGCPLRVPRIACPWYDPPFKHVPPHPVPLPKDNPP
jgi:hypothetical protein